jgi:hypothetical protein
MTAQKRTVVCERLLEVCMCKLKGGLDSWSNRIGKFEKNGGSEERVSWNTFWESL